MEAYGQLQETKFSQRKFPGNFGESFRLGKLPETDAAVTRKVVGDWFSTAVNAMKFESTIVAYIQ